MGIYIQLKDKLRKLSNEVTSEDVTEALGYTPADQESVDSIHDAESGEYYVTDKDGNIILKIDAEGVHTTEVELGDTSEEKIKVKEFIQNYSAASEATVAELTTKVGNHLTDTTLHKTTEERETVDVSNTEALYIVDANGNIGAKIDSEGLHVIEVRIGNETDGEKTVAELIAVETNRAKAAEEANATAVTEETARAQEAEENLANTKQDNLVFDGTYNAESNKAATVQTVIDKVAEIVANAPEDFDTLKELSDWLTTHGGEAAEMNSAIKQNTEDIAEETARATAAENALSEKIDTDLDNLEKQLSEQIVSESEEWHIVDPDGNIVATIDEDGVHSTAFYANGEDIVQKITDIIEGTTTVAKATTAGSATKATQDGDGNVITETYIPKTGGTVKGDITIDDGCLEFASSTQESDAIRIMQEHGNDYGRILALYGAENDDPITLRNVNTPTEDTDAANKKYVDDAVSTSALTIATYGSLTPSYDSTNNRYYVNLSAVLPEGKTYKNVLMVAGTLKTDASTISVAFNEVFYPVGTGNDSARFVLLPSAQPATTADGVESQKIGHLRMTMGVDSTKWYFKNVSYVESDGTVLTSIAVSLEYLYNVRIICT